MFHGSNLCTGIQAGALWFRALNAQRNEWISQAHFRSSSHACKSFLWMKWWLWQCNYSAVQFKNSGITQRYQNVCSLHARDNSSTLSFSLKWNWSTLRNSYDPTIRPLWFWPWGSTEEGKRTIKFECVHVLLPEWAPSGKRSDDVAKPSYRDYISNVSQSQADRADVTN